MFMNQLIAMFFPATISLKMYKKLDEDCSGIELFQRYMKLILVINLIEYFVLIYIIEQRDFIFTNQFTLKYSLLAIVIAIIYPIFEKIVKVNIKVSAEVEKNNEKDC